MSERWCREIWKLPALTLAAPCALAAAAGVFELFGWEFADRALGGMFQAVLLFSPLVGVFVLVSLSALLIGRKCSLKRWPAALALALAVVCVVGPVLFVLLLIILAGR